MRPTGYKQCPEGYEFVEAHKEPSGKYVRSYCRKKPVQIKMKMKLEYPGRVKGKMSFYNSKTEKYEKARINMSTSELGLDKKFKELEEKK
jgi:hypothetical protein